MPGTPGGKLPGHVEARQRWQAPGVASDPTISPGQCHKIEIGHVGVQPLQRRLVTPSRRHETANLFQPAIPNAKRPQMFDRVHHIFLVGAGLTNRA